MPVVINTDVLDISAGGVLLSTGAAFQQGQRGRLRVLLGEDPFSAAFEVRHVAAGTQSAEERRFHVGAAFTSMDDASRDVLRRFLKTRV